MSRLRVLHVLAPADYGGIETVVRKLAGALDHEGVDVEVVAVLTMDRAEHPFVTAAESDGLSVHVVRAPRRAYGHERRQVADLLHRLRPDVMHTHGYRPDLLDAPLGRARAISTVATAHGFTGNGLRNRFYEWLQRRSFRKFDGVVAVSSGLVQRLVASGVPRDRIHLIPNARVQGSPALSRAEARQALGLTREGPPLVGWVGRVGPEKGPDLIIRALAEPALRGAHLCMVGDGHSVDACEALATDLGVDERVRWAGRVPEAGRFMAAFDVLCLSSRTEGTPMVLFEADQAEVPVVATAVGGVPHVLGDGWNVVPPDDPKLLAAAVATALDDSEAVVEARQRARRRMETEFRASDWARRHVDMYERLVGRTARVAAREEHV